MNQYFIESSGENWVLINETLRHSTSSKGFGCSYDFNYTNMNKTNLSNEFSRKKLTSQTSHSTFKIYLEEVNSKENYLHLRIILLRRITMEFIIKNEDSSLFPKGSRETEFPSKENFKKRSRYYLHCFHAHIIYFSWVP